MRLLFVKERLAWPRSSGHDVHCYHCMRGVRQLGHEVGLITLDPSSEEAIAGVYLSFQQCLRTTFAAESNGAVLSLSKWQEKFRSYWGIETSHIKQIGKAARTFQADAVVVVGLNVLPYLGAVQNCVKIWYAADEWFWHHVSQLRVSRPQTWGELKMGLIKGWYERAYAPLLDRVWMVSQADRKAIQWVAGVRAVDVMPNGVDAEYYQPLSGKERPNSCVFWGRLDFGPNIQGLEWFCRKIWPLVRSQSPQACFSIYGFQPTAPVLQLAQSTPGVELIPNLPDLRERIAEHAVVVLPFVSGGGIKNKLLEAAAMGKAIICSKRTDRELAAGSALVRASTPTEWAASLLALWSDDQRRRNLGEAARQWVVRHHAWNAVAEQAIAGIRQTLQQNGAA